jgi:hypothetical protein
MVEVVGIEPAGACGRGQRRTESIISCSLATFKRV